MRWTSQTDPAVTASRHPAELATPRVGAGGPPPLGGVASHFVSILDSAFGFVTGAIFGAIVLCCFLKDGLALFDRRLERTDARSSSIYRDIGDRTVVDE